MSHNTRKVKKLSKKTGAEPMPSLIFHEGNLDENKNPAEEPAAPKVFLNSSAYNPTARRLMWFGVILLTLVICGLWTWSIMTQFYDINWSKSSEESFLGNLRTSWDKSFGAENGQSPSTDQLKSEVKKSLIKLFADAASSTTTTPN